MAFKLTPKSCSCFHCKRSKGSAAVKEMMKKEERAFRHASNQALRSKDVDADILIVDRRNRMG